ncbi:sensor histidine kinase [Solicola sp. PLA-1-18]|uniref:sensor histidine kinase n=1 Tax=Solicola sp. PLA-1-18 TaxID=3380532 RepID=UPI003B80D2C9
MRERLDAWLRGHPLVVDAAITLLLAAPVLLSGAVGTAAAFVDAALFVPLVLRRRLPVVMFTLVGLELLVLAIVDDGTGRYGAFVLLPALYAIAAYGPRWARWGGLTTGMLGAGIASLRWPGGAIDPSRSAYLFVFLLAAVGVAWLAGAQVRTRREYTAQLVATAQEREREAETQARLAASTERARIAREMHDVVAHSLSVIVVQADGAAYAARSRPEAAIEALGTISDAGRSSLAEMRRLLGLLRGEDDADAERAPVPGAADLGDLVEQVRANGLAVDLHVDDAARTLPPATGLTVYRVVQEALTNVLKHAGPGAAADVEVTLADGQARVRVGDDGRGGSAAPTGGFGLQGMRERIALHEGTVDAAPRPGGGFLVTAHIPTRAPEDR